MEGLNRVPVLPLGEGGSLRILWERANSSAAVSWCKGALSPTRLPAVEDEARRFPRCRCCLTLGSP